MEHWDLEWVTRYTIFWKYKSHENGCETYDVTSGAFTCQFVDVCHFLHYLNVLNQAKIRFMCLQLSLVLHWYCPNSYSLLRLTFFLFYSFLWFIIFGLACISFIRHNGHVLNAGLEMCVKYPNKNMTRFRQNMNDSVILWTVFLAV